jgi:pseudouridine-5'-phosphate glycosidase
MKNELFEIHTLPELATAIRNGSPVVALESALITHGLPYPQNLEVAQELEGIIRSAGAVPATVALLNRKVHIGLSAAELRRLAQSPRPRKVSLRDLAACILDGEDGGTTVAATAHLARHAGIEVFATGGIGGVHRGQPFDVSADLPLLASTPIAVVCAGAKSILDLPLTLEWLETHGVPVVGFQTTQFPAFYSRESGLPVDFRAETADEVAAFARAHWGLGLRSAVLVGVPIAAEAGIAHDAVEGAIRQALADAERDGIHGKAITPYLLARVSQLTEGESLQANLALLRRNAQVGAELAVSLAAVRQSEYEQECVE